MRYIVDVNQRQSQMIQSLIDRKSYESVAEFLSTAIENQLYIEKTVVTQGKPESQKPVETKRLAAQPISMKKIYHDLDGHPQMNIHSNLTFDTRPEAPAFVSSEPRIDETGSLTPGQLTWLWGQVNRIFPIKLGLRVLVRMLGNQWVDLDSFRDKAAEIAASYGEMLRDHERWSGKKRGERISAGMPGGAEPFKSKERFKSLFIGYIRKDNKLDGAMPFLKFVGMTRDPKSKTLIGLTEEGFNFACLKNPVIDLGNCDEALDQAEREFYLQHVLLHVPAEYEALQWLLKALSEGTDTRVGLNQRIHKEIDVYLDASEAVINTQRAGLTSRAIELGLVTTVSAENGVNVRYKTTTAGESFLRVPRSTTEFDRNLSEHSIPKSARS